jgi:prenyl protein peptidase
VTLAYVVPFYLSKTTRPSPTLSRDAPSVIRSRVRAVTMACAGSTMFILIVVALTGLASLPEAFKLLGWWPLGILEIIQSLLLTAVLFSGPLFERGVAENGWKSWIRGEGLSETLQSWIGFRNFVAVCVESVDVLVIILLTVMESRALSQRRSSSAPSSSLFTC